MSVYNVPYSGITMDRFKEICPSLIQQKLSNACQKDGSAHRAKMEDHPTDLESKHLRIIVLLSSFFKDYWAIARDFGTSHISEQQRLRPVCAYAQTGLSLRCLHTQSMDIYEGLRPTVTSCFVLYVCMGVY